MTDKPKELSELSCDRERVAFIFNPASGQADAGRRQSALEQFLKDAGLTCALAQTTVERGADVLARKAIEDGMVRVIVSGGDGTVMEAAGALVGTGVTLGIVPGGTGNLFALNLGIPPDPEEAIRLALTGRPAPIDAGLWDATPFLLMAGMGWDAKMIEDAGGALKRRFGVLAYFWAALKNLALPSALFRIRIDGRSLRRRAKSVIVANVGRITGGLQAIPDTHPSDGRLEVAILRAESLVDFAGLLWSALRGKVREDTRLERFHARDILIESARPQPLQIDGNPAGDTTHAEIHVLEHALQVVLPEPEPLKPQMNADKRR